ncbi:MAG: uracil-DNA glycosylase [Planctomycetia bacterium]|nr:uracil-DNA glycosylase [Planctomycetia bacterium]
MAARSRRKTSEWDSLNREIVACTRCPRLREYCQRVALEKRAAFRDRDYWGKPVPNFGDPRGRLLVVGLAPAAHGGNRTGRVFTGDRSGDWLFRALYKAGFANQSQSVSREDGLELTDCAVTAAVHCAPPANKPLPVELVNCHDWFERTIDLMPLQVFMALGQIAWRAVVAEARRRQWLDGKTPKFAHGAQAELAGGRWLLGSYHPSQQNTFTGRLTEEMFDGVFRAARRLLK